MVATVNHLGCLGPRAACRRLIGAGHLSQPAGLINGHRSSAGPNAAGSRPPAPFNNESTDFRTVSAKHDHGADVLGGVGGTAVVRGSRAVRRPQLVSDFG